MKTVPLKLVTIVAEAVLEKRLIDDLKANGATGYTMTYAMGEGSRGVRASDWEGRNLRIEVIAAPEVADRILEKLANDYFPKYAVIAYMENVEVVRGDKYVTGRSDEA